MPRDGTKNLKTMAERSPEEVKEMQRKGGINSGIARRKKKSMRESMAALLEAQVTPNVVNNLKKRGYKGEAPETYNDALNVSMLIQAMMKGDVRAYVAVMELMGEKTQVLDINPSNEKFAEVLDLWNAKKGKK